MIELVESTFWFSFGILQFFITREGGILMIPTSPQSETTSNSSVITKSDRNGVVPLVPFLRSHSSIRRIQVTDLCLCPITLVLRVSILFLLRFPILILLHVCLGLAISNLRGLLAFQPSLSLINYYNYISNIILLHLLLFHTSTDILLPDKVCLFVFIIIIILFFPGYKTMSGVQLQSASPALTIQESQKNECSVTVATGAESKPKKKICCACPDTKRLRDECIVEHGEAACAKWIEAHRLCLRAEGFNV
ncbi:hypothetical protein VNO78_06451 [Psophocarpus tetragonolobus]|uniref:Cytochrome c oxidase copper chaperone n=1 Tax=Psophocarpus tetragonolobus TaxID=3891 RepID=A0AAN9T243_PSOTE